MVRQFGLRGLVIDPYNEIESTRGANMSETEFISYLLSKIKRFAQTYDVHVWIVAHPRKMNAIDGVTPIPGLYDIGGSAHWANKADLGWCVSRDRADTSKPTELHVLKVRFKECGSAGGIANFSWDKWSGRYSAFMEESPEVYRKAYADG
jgi:twinkle protein